MDEAVDRFDYDQAVAWYMTLTGHDKYFLAAPSKVVKTTFKRLIDKAAGSFFEKPHAEGPERREALEVVKFIGSDLVVVVEDQVTHLLGAKPDPAQFGLGDDLVKPLIARRPRLRNLP